MKGKRKGFALPLVLAIMLALSTLAVIMMELATSRFSNYYKSTERERRYNAAQGGIEWAKPSFGRTGNSSIESKRPIPGAQQPGATRLQEELAFNLSVPIPSSDMTVEVTVLDCN